MSEKDSRSLGEAVTGACELPRECWEPNPGVLEERQALLITELSSPLDFIVKFNYPSAMVFPPPPPHGGFLFVSMFTSPGSVMLPGAVGKMKPERWDGNKLFCFRSGSWSCA